MNENELIQNDNETARLKLQTILDKRKEQNKRYYEANKASIMAKHMTICSCDICGSGVASQHLKRHQKTKICKKRAEMKNLIQ